MPTYTAHFFTVADWASTTIKAANPKQALRRARRIERDKPETLNFRSYDTTDGIDLIEIEATGTNRRTVITWQSEDRLLRLAAGDLLEALDEQTEAAQAVLDCWERGNLAGAVCRLDGTIAAARAAIAKAKGGAS